MKLNQRTNIYRHSTRNVGINHTHTELSSAKLGKAMKIADAIWFRQRIICRAAKQTMRDTTMPLSAKTKCCACLFVFSSSSPSLATSIRSCCFNSVACRQPFLSLSIDNEMKCDVMTQKSTFRWEITKWLQFVDYKRYYPGSMCMCGIMGYCQWRSESLYSVSVAKLS